MDISNKKFKEVLRNRFVELLESKRGVQSKLAKSIGKTASYFSEIKRGNPVNALHLKAVGIVFGPEKVIELLDITNKCCEEEKIPQKMTNIVVQHQDVVKNFKDHERAKEFNEMLVEIESEDPEGYEELFKEAKTISKTIKRLKGVSAKKTS